MKTHEIKPLNWRDINTDGSVVSFFETSSDANHTNRHIVANNIEFFAFPYQSLSARTGDIRCGVYEPLLKEMKIFNMSYCHPDGSETHVESIPFDTPDDRQLAAAFVGASARMRELSAMIFDELDKVSMGRLAARKSQDDARKVSLARFMTGLDKLSDSKAPGEKVTPAEVDALIHQSDIDPFADKAIEVCDNLGIELIENHGKWHWKNQQGETSALLLDSKSQAAMSAMENQFPKEDWLYEVNNNDTKRSYREWLEVSINMAHDDIGNAPPSASIKKTTAPRG